MNRPSPPQFEPTPGRVVSFVLGYDAAGCIVIRPAVVVRVVEHRVNLQVFTDGEVDDGYLRPFERSFRDGLCVMRDTAGIVHRTLVPYDGNLGEGTWHWPTRLP